MFEKRKGISTFIATLLLMVLAVSAGVVIYAYTMGYMGGFGGTDTLGAMSLDEVSMVEGTTETTIEAYVRNIGKTSIALDLAYVDGVQVDIVEVIVGGSSTGDIAPITEGDVGLVKITGSWAAGSTYDVKLIAEDNTQISFSVKCE